MVLSSEACYRLCTVLRFIRIRNPPILVVVYVVAVVVVVVVVVVGGGTQVSPGPRFSGNSNI